MKKSDITTDILQMKSIIRKYDEQLHTNTLGYLDEIVS